MNLEMAELKTQKNEASVQDFLKGIEDENKQKASNIVSEMMAEVTGAEPKMWGDSIVGFGTYKYKYASGREGEWFLTGFAPRKRNVTLYIMSGFDDYADLLGKLGKFSTGKSCLYINKVEDIDLDVLRELVEKSVKHMVETNS
jgi:nucleoid DNA-binding protein